MSNKMTVKIWRRGRGVIKWDFEYILKGTGRFHGEKWFSSPGWYRFANQYAYRLTLDHDYPSKPMWLGRRENGKWVSMEGLYEPLTAIHPDYIFASSRVARPTRSLRRVMRSIKLINSTVNDYTNLKVGAA